QVIPEGVEEALSLVVGDEMENILNGEDGEPLLGIEDDQGFVYTEYDQDGETWLRFSLVLRIPEVQDYIVFRARADSLEKMNEIGPELQSIIDSIKLPGA